MAGNHKDGELLSGAVSILSIINDKVYIPAVILDEKGNILEANTVFCEMLHYAASEIVGKNWPGLTARDCQHLDTFKFAELRDTGQAGPWRTALTDSEGNRVPVLVRLSHMADAAGRFLGIVWNGAEFEESERELRTLAGKLLKLYDEERRRIARELHDTTAQNLAALSMNLAILGTADPVRSAEIMAECSSLTEECLKDVRSLSYMLHPPLLDELGLETALRTFISLYERGTGVSVSLHTRAPVGRLPAEVELGAFRIAQESLFNVQRHSGSVRAEVKLAREGTQFEVSVRDWGIGIAPDDANGDSLGIAGMRERVRLLGGQLEIGPAGPGTMVRAVFRTDQ